MGEAQSREQKKEKEKVPKPGAEARTLPAKVPEVAATEPGKQRVEPEVQKDTSKIDKGHPETIDQGGAQAPVPPSGGQPTPAARITLDLHWPTDSLSSPHGRSSFPRQPRQSEEVGTTGVLLTDVSNLADRIAESDMSMEQVLERMREMLFVYEKGGDDTLRDILSSHDAIEKRVNTLEGVLQCTVNRMEDLEKKLASLHRGKKDQEEDIGLMTALHD